MRTNEQERKKAVILRLYYLGWSIFDIAFSTGGAHTSRENVVRVIREEEARKKAANERLNEFFQQNEQDQESDI